MEQCTLYCVTTESDSVADILDKNDKRIKVAVAATDISVVLTRTDIRQPYIGFLGALEFETFGELE